jgi:hypothetical protein
MQGICVPPPVAIEQLEALARTLDEDADFLVRTMGEQGSAAAVLLVYRRDHDIPPSRGLRTVGYHLALARRVAERRPDVQFVTYDRHPYRHSRNKGLKFRAANSARKSLPKAPFQCLTPPFRTKNRHLEKWASEKGAGKFRGGQNSEGAKKGAKIFTKNTVAVFHQPFRGVSCPIA